MEFITFFLTISKDSGRSYYSPARWTNGHSIKGIDGKKVSVSGVENGSKDKQLPPNTPSALLPDGDVDASNLPEKISWNVKKQTTVPFVEQS